MATNFLRSHPQISSFCRGNICSSTSAANTREAPGFWSIGDTFVRGEMTQHSGTKCELIAAQEPGADIAIGAATLLASLVLWAFRAARTFAVVDGPASSCDLPLDPALRAPRSAVGHAIQQALSFVAQGTEPKFAGGIRCTEATDLPTSPATANYSGDGEGRALDATSSLQI